MRDRDGDRTVRTRTMVHAHGHWTLRVKHEAGSLEAAVAASRRRNLALSGGVLALLGVVVALIAVSARRAQALARRQMEFVAAVSHELRTPVAVINSAAGNLADGVVGDPARVKRYGATIQTEARRLGDTVERVLQLAGLGSGRPLPMTRVAPDPLVHEAVRLSAADAAEAGVQVQVEMPADLPAVLGDAGTLQSAVQNLIGNAIKYAGADRWVRVAVTARRAPRREVRIAVEDHGDGLDAEEQRLVFEPFFRGKAAVANQIKGSGLGLSLVRRIADAHGGRVELVSSPGHGSTFTICLPAAPDAPAPCGSDRRSLDARRPHGSLSGRRTRAARGRRARPAAHAERSAGSGGLRRRNRGRRRAGPDARAHGRLRSRGARRHAAEARRLRRVPHAAPARDHHAHPDAHRARPGRGPRGRPEARRRRLPGEAVRGDGAAGPHRGAAAPGRPRRGAAGRHGPGPPASSSTTSRSTRGRPKW